MTFQIEKIHTDNVLDLQTKSSPEVNDLYTDLRDGKNLIILLQVLTGKNLVGICFIVIM